MHIQIVKGMCRLPQAGILANKLLAKRLAVCGHHDTRPVMFTSCIDNFGVKYTNKQDAEHLLQGLQEVFRILFVGVLDTKVVDA